MKLVLFWVFFTGLFCLGLANLSLTDYSEIGSQVLRISPQLTAERVETVRTLELKGLVDFWTSPSKTRSTDVLVKQDKLQDVKSYLLKNGLEFSTTIQDVGALILRQKREERQGGDMGWDAYHRYDTIMGFLDTVAAQHPDIATVETYGRSTEGRDLKVIKLGTPGTNKSALFFDAAMHAREWAGPAIVTYFINELVENRNTTAYQALLNSVDIYITPLANPDGYEYTHTTYRLWRKTRSYHDSPSGCMGVDPNRNFGVAWGGEGTSPDKCSDIYHGPAAFSEPETAAMRDFILRKQQEGVNWQAYFAVHSYGQMWLVPWGWTVDLPDTYPELRAFGDLAVAALTPVHGTEYQVGSVTEVLTAGAGGSDDWAYGSGIFRYSQTVEVRDLGRYGFLLPADQIIPAGQENWEAVQAVARFLAA